MEKQFLKGYLTRTTSATYSQLICNTAFFECPQCKYRYNYNRTKALGIAKSPSKRSIIEYIVLQCPQSLRAVLLGAATAVMFTCLVMVSSFITTLFFRPFDSDYDSGRSSYFFYWSSGPFDFVYDFVRSTLGIIQDQESRLYRNRSYRQYKPPGFFRRFVNRFLMGLPLVSAGSLLQLLSMPLMAPLQLLTRWRGYRRNRDTADFATIIIVGLIILGAAKYV
jgi:hypothetical protein